MKKARKGKLHAKPQIGKGDQETWLPGRNALRGKDPHWNVVLSKDKKMRRKRISKVYKDV
jgi:hypothetical protein